MICAVLFTTALALGAQGTDWCEDVEAPMRSATAAIAAKKYDEADRILAQLESKHPLCWEVQLELGGVRYELGDYRGALVASELATAAARAGLRLTAPPIFSWILIAIQRTCERCSRIKRSRSPASSLGTGA